MFFHKGLTYSQLESESESLIKKSIKLGGITYEVDHVFSKIGDKKRTSLSPGYSMKYCGMIEDYILLLPIVNLNFEQLDMFSIKKVTYLTPVLVDEYTLLMQSSENGFWDIRI